MASNESQRNLTVYQTLSAGLAELGWKHMWQKLQTIEGEDCHVLFAFLVLLNVILLCEFQQPFFVPFQSIRCLLLVLRYM